MHRSELKDKHGMLFIFSKPSYPSIWMKNTLIPLDIIWMDSSFKVVDLKKNAKPLSTTIHKPKKKSNFVLELNRGSIKKHNIKIGSIFKPKT